MLQNIPNWAMDPHYSTPTHYQRLCIADNAADFAFALGFFAFFLDDSDALGFLRISASVFLGISAASNSLSVDSM